MAEWTCDYYTSVSDSSGCLSARNDGNQHRYYSNSAMNAPDDFETWESTKSSKFTRLGQSDNPHKVFNKSENQYFQITGHCDLGESRSRSPRQKREQRDAFDQSFRMSRSLPNSNPHSGKARHDEDQSVCSIDMHELLSRSQAQEAKLAELQRKLLGQCRPDICCDSSSDSDRVLTRGQGHSNDLATQSGCHRYWECKTRIRSKCICVHVPRV